MHFYRESNCRRFELCLYRTSIWGYRFAEWLLSNRHLLEYSIFAVTSHYLVVGGQFHQLPFSSPIMESRIRFQPSSSLYQVSLLFGLYPKFFRCKKRWISRKLGRSTSFRCQHSPISSYISLGQFLGSGKIICNKKFIFWISTNSLNFYKYYKSFKLSSKIF